MPRPAEREESHDRRKHIGRVGTNADARRREKRRGLEPIRDQGCRGSHKALSEALPVVAGRSSQGSEDPRGTRATSRVQQWP